MTYSSRKDLISAGLGRGGLDATASACWSSVMISLQMSMHSLQMYTVGPAISFFTSFCDLPQKEQRNVSSVRRTIGVFRGTPYQKSVQEQLSGSGPEAPGASDFPGESLPHCQGIHHRQK